MEIDNRILVAVVVIAIVVLFVFFGGQEEQISFSDGVSKVNDLWTESGFDRSSLRDLGQSQVALEQLNALESELVFFQDSLSEYKQDKGVEALSDFIEIQLYVVEELKLALKINNAKNELVNATEEDVCSYFYELNVLGENTILLNEQMRIVNEAVLSFSENYPEFLDESNLESLLVDDSDFDSVILENQEVLEQLKEACT